MFLPNVPGATFIPGATSILGFFCLCGAGASAHLVHILTDLAAVN